METPTPYSRRQRRIESRLRRFVGDGAVDNFISAIELLPRSEMPERSNLVWHMAREIDSALLWVLGPMTGVAAWREQPNKDAIDRETFSAEGVDHRKARITAAVVALELDDRHPDLIWWKSKALFHKRAHRRGLGSPRPFDDTEWTHFEGVKAAGFDL